MVAAAPAWRKRRRGISSGFLVEYCIAIIQAQPEAGHNNDSTARKTPEIKKSLSSNRSGNAPAWFYYGSVGLRADLFVGLSFWHFYGAMETNDSTLKVLGTPRLQSIARILVRTVRANVTINRTLHDNVPAQLRVLVKRVLRKYAYPADEQAKATQTVLEQAELLCGEAAAAWEHVHLELNALEFNPAGGIRSLHRFQVFETQRRGGF